MALNESSNLMVTVNSHNDYIGEGEFAVTIVDDDRKWIYLSAYIVSVCTVGSSKKDLLVFWGGFDGS